MGRVMAVNHHLKIALDLVSDAVAIIDCGPLASQGPPILYANRALAAACGMDPAALVGQPLAAITADPAPLLAALRIGHPEPTPVKGTLPGRIPCSWLCAPVRDASGRILNYILTAKPLPASPAPQPGALRHFDGPPPSPDKWSQDMVDIVIESSRFVAHEFNTALTAILSDVPTSATHAAFPATTHSATATITAVDNSLQPHRLSRHYDSADPYGHGREFPCTTIPATPSGPP
jgi:hypothetical protein